MFDVTLAVVLLCALSPVLLVVSLLVRVFLGSPVVFRQRRPGLDGKSFTLYKFRSMHAISADCENDAARLGRFGRALRASSLDELPELWNIVRGDMSFVGPRPLLEDYMPHYTRRQNQRHQVRPGLTGWAQIHGRNAVCWRRRLALDVWYVKNHGFCFDLLILVRTVGKVLGRSGVHAEGHATMTRFDEQTTHKFSPKGQE